MKKAWILACLTLSLGPASLAVAASKTVTIRSEALIKDVLELVISQEGRQELRFGNVASPLAPTKLGPQTILIQVSSNTGERYQVTQLVSGALQNAEGDEIRLENLEFTSSPVSNRGTGISVTTPVSTASQTLFVSDAAGSGETIAAEYTLTIPALQAPGDYTALLTYTASAL